MLKQFKPINSTFINRRSFVKKVMVGFAAAALAANKLNASIYEKLTMLEQKYSPLDAPDGIYWDYIAKQYMFEPDLIMMNNGTAGAMPRVVFNTLTEFFKIQAANPYKCYATFYPYQDEVRQQIAQFIGASPDEIALIRNATEGLNIVAKGLDMKPGDEVVLTNLEHPAGLYPWKLQEKRFGIKIKEATLKIPPKNKDDILNAFNDAISPRTRIIQVMHAFYNTGLIAPVKELSQLAKDKNVLFVVDGAHNIGMHQLDMHDLGIDFYISSTYKWLGAPTGTGIFYARKEVQDELWPDICEADWENMQGARKYDRVGRVAEPLIIALGEAVRFQSHIGKERIERRIKALGTYLREQASQIPGVELFTPLDPYLSCGLTVLVPDGINNEHLVNYMMEKYNLVITRVFRERNGVRICTHIWITYKHIDTLLQGLKDLLGKKL
jgi:isopenicillin-N epimerase